MKAKIILRGLAVVLLIAGVESHGQEADADRETPDWWKAQRDAVDILMEQKTDIAELVAKVTASEPKTGQQAMFKLTVLMRAGMNTEAINTVRELKGLCPHLDNDQIQSIYYEACDHFSAWDVAQSLVEVFADNISELNLENRLLKHFQESGWSVEKVDRWLADMPTGIDSFWLKQRLRFNTLHGRGERLVQELTNSVRRNPKDIEGAIRFLDCLVYAGHAGDLSWMAQTIKPELATQAEDIASRLKRLSNWASAITFYKKAIGTPVTDKEVRQLSMMCAAYVPMRAMFAVRTREEMVECLLDLGRNDEAQKWMVEAQDIRQKHKLGQNALLAGKVQGASGQRVIEERIKEREKKSENDPEYWRERAGYYRGRGEIDKEEEALKKGLILTTPQTKPDRQSRGHVDWRSWLLADYAHFLARVNRISEAVALLRNEIEQSPANSQSAVKAARILAFDFAKQLGADDKVLWSWLADRPKWEHTEKRLLWRMLESAKQDDLDKYFSRAEELVKRKETSRAHTLGWIMNRMHFPKRSIPLLEYAVEKAPDKKLKEPAVFTLFESYLDTGDWKRAEQIFPEASKRLTPREVSDWCSRIAVIAAKAGEKADAMRLWKVAANVDLTDMGDLDDLAEAGLRDELIAFYSELGKKLRSSEIPARALTEIEK